MKLLIGLGFKLGFIPNFYFHVHRARFPVPQSPLSSLVMLNIRSVPKGFQISTAHC